MEKQKRDLASLGHMLYMLLFFLSLHLLREERDRETIYSREAKGNKGKLVNL